MIKYIRMKNFKSIIEDEVSLKPLTILVGANGSGKSNLIKAVEFISTIPTMGMVGAISKFGDFSGIIPKSLPKRQVKSTHIEIAYQKVLRSPDQYPADFPPITVEHEFSLAYSKEEVIRIAKEKLTFNNALAVSASLKNQHDEKATHLSEFEAQSCFILDRTRKGNQKYSVKPAINNKTIPLFLEWLGLGFLEEDKLSKKRFNDMLSSIGGFHSPESNLPSQPKLEPYNSFLDPEVSTIIDYSPQARRFRGEIQSIRRYDLLLNELRREQQFLRSKKLSANGSNMPSVLRYLQDTEGIEKWSRLMTTFGTIAPHIGSIRPSLLGPGREFVEFLENSRGRGVESWESSDGTLRALAILLALETQPYYGVILIEEPEQNLHPWAIRTIMDHIREVIKERAIQVVIATHSQQVLESAHPEEVLIATRTTDRGTQFKTLQELLPLSDIEMGEIGNLWVKGLLGGVPTYDSQD